MLTRELLQLARLGYSFPKQNALHDVAPLPPKAKYPGVRIRVKKDFFGLRRLLTADEVVTLAEPDAVDAIALGRAERI